jgi:hypothetical protein
MPYRVEKAKYRKFAVVYALPSNSNATAEVFWTNSQADAQREADRMNQSDRLVNEQLEKVLSELRVLLETDDEERILKLISIWLTEKQQCFQQETAPRIASAAPEE